MSTYSSFSDLQSFSPATIERINSIYQELTVKSAIHAYSSEWLATLVDVLGIPTVILSTGSAGLALVSSTPYGRDNSWVGGATFALSTLVTIVQGIVSGFKMVEKAMLHKRCSQRCRTLILFLQREMAVNFASKNQTFIPIASSPKEESGYRANNQPILHTVDEYLAYLFDHLDQEIAQLEDDEPALPLGVHEAPFRLQYKDVILCRNDSEQKSDDEGKPRQP